MIGNDFLWSQKYRPRTIADTILPDKLKATFSKFVQDKNIPNLLLSGTSGVGKCLHPDEPVLMFDGTIKKTGDLLVGDRLMGPDSQPRVIIHTNPGFGPMFEICPNKGKTWKCNGEHILSLKRTGQRDSEPKFVTVNDWMKWSKYEKSLYKLWRTEVEFAPIDAPELESYFVGVVLGDGTVSDSLIIHNPDPEIITYISDYAQKWNLRCVNNARNNPKKCPSWALTSGMQGGRPNLLLDAIRPLSNWKCENKSVPHIYKVGSKDTRLQILAGLLDTDGYRGPTNCYDFISKSETLANDVAFISRSVGLYANVKPSVKGCQNGFVGNYFRVTISGQTDKIPCRVKRKIATKRKQIKDVCKTGFVVKPIGNDRWFGIEIDGDKQYLLSDFTVTHNTTVARAMLEEIGCDYLIINGSLEGRNIDTLRTTILTFASTVSLSGGRKYVILDESDYLNCLWEEEEILLSNGSTMKLKNLEYDKNYSVVSFNMETKRFEVDDAVLLKDSEKEVYVLTLDDGTTLTCTEDHPIICKAFDGQIVSRTIRDGLENFEVVALS